MMDLLLGIWPKIVAGLAIVAGAFGFVWKQRRDAVNLDRAKGKEQDRAHANAIRTRVDRDLPSAVRDLDDAGYRD